MATTSQTTPQIDDLPRTISGQVCRAVRLTTMVRMFEAGGEYSNIQIAEMFGVSYDTVERDVNALQDAPLRIPLVCREIHEKRWKMMDDKEE